MNYSIKIDNNDATIVMGKQLDQLSIKRNFWQSHKSNELVSVNSITIDLANVEKVDTAGLAWLLNCLRDAKINKKTCQINHIPSKLVELAKLSNADQLLLEGIKV